jgi:VRR-NUC domain
MTSPIPIERTMSEADLQGVVIDLAHLYRWRVAHFRSVAVKHGDRVAYETPVQADGAGFPDLVLVRGGRVLYRELKSERGTLSAAQQDWLHALRSAGADANVWRPSDWISGEIEAVLH